MEKEVRSRIAAAAVMATDKSCCPVESGVATAFPHLSLRANGSQTAADCLTSLCGASCGAA